LLSHRLKASLHSVDTNRNAVNERERLRVFREHRGKCTWDNVSELTWSLSDRPVRNAANLRALPRPDNSNVRQINLKGGPDRQDVRCQGTLTTTIRVALQVSRGPHLSAAFLWLGGSIRPSPPAWA
jgi:hypothetical protein